MRRLGPRPSRVDRARDALQQRIERNELSDQGRLPSERELAALLNVSRTTLRKALGQLIADGRVEQRHGLGNFALPRDGGETSPSADPSLRQIMAIGASLRWSEEPVRFSENTFGFFQPTAEQAFLLDVAPDPLILRWTGCWIGLAGRPVASETVCALADQVEPGLPLSENPHSVDIRRRTRRLQVQSLSRTVTDTLGLEEKTTGLQIDQRSFGPDGRCLAFARLWCALPGFDMVVALAGPAGNAKPHSGPAGLPVALDPRAWHATRHADKS